MIGGEKQNAKAVKSRSIFRRIVRPLIILTVLDALLLVIVLRAVGVMQQLNQNSYDIFKKQVDNRQSYLQAQMVGKWMQLGDLSDRINTYTASLRRRGELDWEQLDSKPAACAPIIMEVMDDLIAELYAKQVSGIFLTFNTHALTDTEDGRQEKTGVYIRDNDPLSASSERYADLLLECAPVSVVQAMNLSTDSSWEQRYKFGADRPYGDWLTVPYTAAAESGGSLSAEDFGYWSIRQDAEGVSALAYTVPLILPDGTVYGVLGVDMLPAYLSSQLPHSELAEDGVYALFQSVEPGENTGVVNVVSRGVEHFHRGDVLTLEPSRYGGFRIVQDGTQYEAAMTQLNLYSRNAPFEQQHWYVLGAVPTQSLFSFSQNVRWMLVLTIALMLLLGLGCALMVSWLVARPVVALRKEMAETETNEIPTLSPTGITEVDDFAEAITGLSRDVVHASRRFLSIMEMSSIDMGGYELDEQSGFLFVTDNFFQLFGQENVSTANMTIAEFHERMAGIAEANAVGQTNKGSIYSLVSKGGSARYIHVQETQVETRRIGVAEDVTMQILERKRIEHERDYDILTGIYNRRAFYRDATRLLEKPERLGIAIVVMIDLDNLKILNDTYGHEWGDRYIVAGAQCIREHVPSQSVVARVSGDEFNLLIYGFRSREEAADAVEQLQRGFNEACFQLPDGKVKPIGASGGVSFVGDDSTDLRTLIKYADFAMYLVKHGRKGFFGTFDRSLYHASEIEQSKHRAFKRVVREEKVHYVFQPIVDARTGEIHAVEALMRVQDTEIVNTEEFLRIARQENMLDEIEHLTWHHALSAFHRLIETGVLSHKTRVFVNSQVSQILSAPEQKLLIDRFGDIRENTVMEIVETDDYSVELANLRDREQELFALEFALDDFGTGYNNEKNLLELMPQYVKLDMTLVRDVEKHTDRRKLIEGLISFAHTRNMVVLAEGVETQAELHCLISLGVDMLQGYLLARPSDCPNKINDAALQYIREANAE